jgi:predicted RNase H-like HicB family nuclease
MEENTFTFTGHILKEQDGFTGICPDVDVATEGLSLQEAKDNLLEAVSLYVESAIESNLPVIRPIPKEDDPTQNLDLIIESFRLKVDLKVSAYA